MCNSHPGDAGKAPAFGAHETQLAATTRKKKKSEKPTGEDFETARGEQTLCKATARFHPHLGEPRPEGLRKRSVGTGDQCPTAVG